MAQHKEDGNGKRLAVGILAHVDAGRGEPHIINTSPVQKPGIYRSRSARCDPRRVHRRQAALAARLFARRYFALYPPAFFIFSYRANGAKGCCKIALPKKHAQ